MDHSLFIAKLIGPTFVAIAFGMLINPGPPRSGVMRLPFCQRACRTSFRSTQNLLAINQIIGGYS